MKWLQRFFERLFGEHADDAVARFAVGRPSAEVEREKRLENLQTMVEARHRLRELEELEHQQALRKLTEQEKAADVRLKEATAADKEVDVERKAAEFKHKQQEPRPRKEEPKSDVEKVLATFQSYAQAMDWVQETYRPQLEGRGVKEPELSDRLKRAQRFVDRHFNTKGL